MGKNPWAFRIDYDAAIADDERAIAAYTECLEKDWTSDAAIAFYAENFPVEFAKRKAEHSTMGENGLLFHYLIANEKAAEAAGLTPSDIAVLVATHDGFDHPHYERYGTPALKGPALWHYSDELVKKLDWRGEAFLDSRETLKKRLKTAKAALSRHKRNKKLYGGTK